MKRRAFLALVGAVPGALVARKMAPKPEPLFQPHPKQAQFFAQDDEMTLHWPGGIPMRVDPYCPTNGVYWFHRKRTWKV